MLDWLFTSPAVWFTVPALLGTTLFLLKIVLLLVGAGDLHASGDFDFSGHADVPHAHADSVGAFKALSVQAFAAFAMGFGWGGLGALKTTDWHVMGVILTGVACGVALAFLLAGVMNALMDLQSSGNVSIADALGGEGVVYATVPAPGAGLGQVRLVVNGSDRIYSAVSREGEIATHTRVRITKVNSDNTVEVEKA